MLRYYLLKCENIELRAEAREYEHEQDKVATEATDTLYHLNASNCFRSMNNSHAHIQL